MYVQHRRPIPYAGIRSRFTARLSGLLPNFVRRSSARVTEMHGFRTRCVQLLGYVAGCPRARFTISASAGEHPIWR
jgi:hypothetical protein